MKKSRSPVAQKTKTPKKSEEVPKTPKMGKTPKKVETPAAKTPKNKTPKKIEPIMKTPKNKKTPMQVEEPVVKKTPNPKKSKTPKKVEEPVVQAPKSPKSKASKETSHTNGFSKNKKRKLKESDTGTPNKKANFQKENTQIVGIKFPEVKDFSYGPVLKEILAHACLVHKPKTMVVKYPTAEEAIAGAKELCKITVGGLPLKCYTHGVKITDPLRRIVYLLGTIDPEEVKKALGAKELTPIVGGHGKSGLYKVTFKTLKAALAADGLNKSIDDYKLVLKPYSLKFNEEKAVEEEEGDDEEMDSDVEEDDEQMEKAEDDDDEEDDDEEDDEEEDEEDADDDDDKMDADVKQKDDDNEDDDEDDDDEDDDDDDE